MSLGRWRAPLLAAIGVLMLLLTGWGLDLQQRDAHTALVLLILAQGALYLAAVALAWRGGLSRRALVAILGTAALMRLGVLIAPPYLSDDINRYVWDGRVAAAGINPYRYVPVDPHLAALRDDTIFPNVNRSTYAPTIYPPVAELIFLLATRAGESLTWMKATMVGFELVAVALLLRLLQLQRLPRERILVYAWHPLLIWEIAGSGHVDAAMIAFVALALWARERQAPSLVGTALAAATLVKFFPAVIFPALYRRWDWRMPLAAALAVVAAYLPFAGGGDSVLGFLPGYLSEEGLRSGAGFFLWALVERIAPGLRSLGAAPYLALAAAALASLAVYAIRRDKAAARWIASATLLAVAATVLLSPHYPWYFAWLVPFLCFVPQASVLYLTAASPLLYFAPGGADPDRARMVFEAAIYGPFALLAGVELWRRHAARARAQWVEVET